jgi:hypothetical protein
MFNSLNGIMEGEDGVFLHTYGRKGMPSTSVLYWTDKSATRRRKEHRCTRRVVEQSLPRNIWDAFRLATAYKAIQAARILTALTIQ